MAFVLGDAFVRVRPDTAGFEAEASGRLSGALKKAAVAGVAALGAVKVGSFLKDGVTQASDLAEATNVVGLTFKDQASVIEAASKTSATSVGLSSAAYKQATANVGGLLANMGYTSEQSAKTSQSVVTLGADLGSAFNKSPAEAVEAIGSALRGEAEPIRAFNVTLDDAAVKAKAFELGLYSGKGALDANAKAQATLALIYQQTSAVQGDFANTATGLANGQRIAAAGVENLKGVIGSALLPVLTQAVGAFNSGILPALTSFAEDKAPKVAAAASNIGTGLAGVFSILASGEFTAAKSPFGWAEDSKPIDFLFDLREGAIGLYELIVNGDYKGQLRSAFNWDEDGRAVAAILGIRDAVVNLDFSGIVGSGAEAGAAVGSIASSSATLAPLIGEFLTSLPQLSSVLTVGSAVLGFFAEHVDTLVTLMPLLVGAFVAYQVAQTAANVALIAAVPLRLAEIVSNQRHTAALVANTAAVGANSAATVVGAGASTAAAAAENTSLLARTRMTIATVASSVAHGAAAAATGVATAAQWLLNAALSANPIGIVIVAVAALVAALGYFFTQTQTGQAIVTKAWAAIQQGWSALGTGLRVVYDTVIGPVLQLVGTVAVALWDTYVKPKLDAFGRGWAALGAGLRLGYDTVIRPVIELVGAITGTLWDVYVKPKLDAFGAGWSRLGAGLRLGYDTVIAPVVSLVGAVVGAMWDTHVRPKLEAFDRGWSTFGNAMRLVWTGVIKPALEALRDFVSITLGVAFTTGVTAIGNAWDGLKAKAKEPVRFVVDKVINGALIDNFNDLARFFKTPQISRVSLPAGFRDGGLLRGPGTGTSDSILGVDARGVATARVSAGEFVVNARDTLRNLPLLRKINAGLPVFAGGGLVEGAKELAAKVAAGVGTAKAVVSEVIKDPVGVLRSTVTKALTTIADSGMATLAAAVPRQLLDAAVEQAKAMVAAAAPAVTAVATGGGSAPNAGIVALGRWFQGLGARVSEHPSFGGVNPVHKGRGHYEGRAIDVNFGPGGENAIEKAFFDRLVPGVKAQGYKTLWRVAGHFNNLQAETLRAGGLVRGPGTTTSDSILGLDPRGLATARVSRGEFVVNAAATARNYQLLRKLNAGQPVRAGDVLPDLNRGRALPRLQRAVPGGAAADGGALVTPAPQVLVQVLLDGQVIDTRARVVVDRQLATMADDVSYGNFAGR